MKTTRIEIEGETGSRATIFRSGSDIVINTITVHHGRFGAKTREHSDVVTAAGDYQAAAARWGAAVRLQKQLDGRAGTNADVAEYRDVIGKFAD